MCVGIYNTGFEPKWGVWTYRESGGDMDVGEVKGPKLSSQLFVFTTDPSLSLSIALNNGSELLGIFHALLPWEMLFPLINQHPINKLENSNFFIIDGYGQLLYHPLVPSDFQSYVSVATLESQAVLDKLLGYVPRVCVCVCVV